MSHAAARASPAPDRGSAAHHRDAGAGCQNPPRRSYNPLSLKIVLASSSRYRKALLDRLGFPFETIAPNVDETPLADEVPQDLVLRLAKAKAASAAQRSGPAIVIASDQVAVAGGRILGKPGTPEAAVANLMSMAGTTVTFITSLVVANTRGATQQHVDRTHVRMREFSIDEVRRYVELEQPLDCAGGIKSEGRGVLLMDGIETDDPTALIGLPLIRLGAMLRAEGLPPFRGTSAEGTE